MVTSKHYVFISALAPRTLCFVPLNPTGRHFMVLTNSALQLACQVREDLPDPREPGDLLPEAIAQDQRIQRRLERDGRLDGVQVSRLLIAHVGGAGHLRAEKRPDGDQLTAHLVRSIEVIAAAERGYLAVIIEEQIRNGVRQRRAAVE